MIRFRLLWLRPLWLPLAALVLSLADPWPASAQALSPPAATLPNDPFGEEVMLVEKPAIMLSGSGLWESAFETIKANGPPMTIYTGTDDTGFKFDAAVPVAPATNLRPAGQVKLGKTPTGKALKFIHRGSYDAMDATYEAITNYLDDKNLDSRDLFVEQYIKDPVTTPEDDLVVEIFVPLK
jgi:effector-binding domain-containing protein